MALVTAEQLSREIQDSCLSTAKSLTSDMGWADPPFPVQPLLDKFNISEVRERPLNGDARLVYRDGRLIIEVNPLFPPNRRRLSIAHELGHLILNRCSGRDVLFADHGDPVSERLCDRIAGELLAPEWAVRRFFEATPSLAPWQEPVRCSTLIRAAVAFGISVDAMACRVLHDIALAPRTLGIVWRFSRNSSRSTSERALRATSAWHSMTDVGFIPLNKTAPSDSIVAKAFREEGSYSRKEELHLGRLRGNFSVEAAGFGRPCSFRSPSPSRGVLSLIAA